MIHETELYKNIISETLKSETLNEKEIIKLFERPYNKDYIINCREQFNDLSLKQINNIINNIKTIINNPSYNGIVSNFKDFISQIGQLHMLRLYTELNCDIPFVLYEKESISFPWNALKNTNNVFNLDINSDLRIKFEKNENQNVSITINIQENTYEIKQNNEMITITKKNKKKIHNDGSVDIPINHFENETIIGGKNARIIFYEFCIVEILYKHLFKKTFTINYGELSEKHNKIINCIAQTRKKLYDSLQGKMSNIIDNDKIRTIYINIEEQENIQIIDIYNLPKCIKNIYFYKYNDSYIISEDLKSKYNIYISYSVKDSEYISLTNTSELAYIIDKKPMVPDKFEETIKIKEPQLKMTKNPPLTKTQPPEKLKKTIEAHQLNPTIKENPRERLLTKSPNLPKYKAHQKESETIADSKKRLRKEKTDINKPSQTYILVCIVLLTIIVLFYLIKNIKNSQFSYIDKDENNNIKHNL